MQQQVKYTLVGNNKIIEYPDKILFIKKRTSKKTTAKEVDDVGKKKTKKRK